MDANECPVCHYQAKDLDELLEHIEGSCQKGLDELAEEVRRNPRHD